jgi:hypothetical protein
MPRAVVAEASERLASKLSALAAEGLAVQESGKRFAAPEDSLMSLCPIAICIPEDRTHSERQHQVYVAYISFQSVRKEDRYVLDFI